MIWRDPEQRGGPQRPPLTLGLFFSLSGFAQDATRYEGEEVAGFSPTS